MQNSILGISAFYHDSAAALLVDGEIIAAAHEERFSRVKHDSSFPGNAIEFVLSEGGMSIEELSSIAFYDKPYIKFERLLETYHAFAPRGLNSFLMAIPVWIKEKLFMKRMLWEELEKIAKHPIRRKPELLFPEHHLSHAASAFYPSPFEDAAILTIDGVGEWATTTIGKGEGSDITVLRELPFPHSIGLLYSAFTYYCGFRVNSGEYKLMGLAPYGGHGTLNRVNGFKDKILGELVDVREDGSLLLNMDYFEYATGLRMCNDRKWQELFGLEKREPESDISQPYMDMALAIQQVTEETVLKLAATSRELTGSKNLVMAGGVALNCVANAKILQANIFDNVWIQPAAGDAGGALGAALAGYYIAEGVTRKIEFGKPDAMQGAYLGPEFSEKHTKSLVRKYNAPFRHYPDFDEMVQDVADVLSRGEIIGWFQGRMEYGPRALGNRSIIGDPRNPEMQKTLNLKIKYREGFRPFAPSVLVEDAGEYFDIDVPSPYMLLVAQVNEARCRKEERESKPQGGNEEDMFKRLYRLRSDIPAITHIDYSARLQTVDRATNEKYWRLINGFKDKTGYGVIVNTSFNVRGEPIVCTPEDAYRCFMRTEMDWLVIGNFVFRKKDQPPWQEKENWQEMFTLD